MTANQVHNPYDLLGQTPEATPPVQLLGSNEPALNVGWGEFRQGVGSSVGALFERTGVSKEFTHRSIFTSSWVDRRIPQRAIVAAVLWHIAVLIFPWPGYSGPKKNHAFDNFQLTWSGPIEDFPLIQKAGPKAQPSPRGEPNKPSPSEGADALHPRQRIFTDPARPTHPRQTLINSAAPPDAPKLLPEMPNVVQLAQSDVPARPKIEISEDVLRKLRPIQRQATSTTAAAPELTSEQQRPSDLSIATSQNEPMRPKLQVNTGSAPHVAKQNQSGEATPAPDVQQSVPSAPNGASSALIALSAAPAPPGAVQPPQGNLSARVSIAPEGKKAGVPGGTGTSPTDHGGSGNGTMGGANGGSDGAKSSDISISRGNPTSPRVMSGLGGSAARNPAPRLNLSVSSSPRPSDDPPERAGPPNFSALAPDAKPEEIFSGKRVYTMNVNMPNLNSATGSWILNFSELHASGGHSYSTGSNEVSAPAVLHKVDPRYPQTLINEHVEGEVILYAVIRSNGSVDSIQIVKGIDDLLDANAVQALGQWKFKPGMKQDTPVDLEAIVHIPFRAPEPR